MTTVCSGDGNAERRVTMDIVSFANVQAEVSINQKNIFGYLAMTDPYGVKWPGGIFSEEYFMNQPFHFFIRVSNAKGEDGRGTKETNVKNGADAFL